MKQVAIKLTSAIGISGVMYRAGSIVEVSEDAGKQLLNRGKGVLATAEDQPEEEGEQGGETEDEPDPAPEGEDKPDEKKPSGKKK